MKHVAWFWLSFGGALAGGCSADMPAPPQPSGYTQGLLNQLARSPREEGSAPARHVVVAAPVPPPPAPVNAPPELVVRDVPTQVAPGHEVSFGLDVVDDAFDPVRVELGAHPPGAELDARTLTVHWRVRAQGEAHNTFHVRILEDVGAAEPRVTERDFAIDVVPHPTVTANPPVPLVGAMVTITDPAFLARTAHDWPIERLLEVARDAAIDALPPAEQHTVQRRPGRELFRDLLSQYAEIHQNPRVDPTSSHFDRRFESAHWRLVSVRPRVNKSIEELRLAFRAVDVPEPVFAMFRMRLFRGANAPDSDLVHANNVAFTRLVHQAYFQGTHLRPGIAEGRAPAVNAAVASLVRSVMTFRDPQNAALRVGLAAIPEEARLGGGSEFDADGTYLNGNAWAFSVANFRIDPPAGEAPRGVHVANVPISSFTFDVGDNDAHDAFTSLCPPRYHEGGAGNEPGLAALCAPDGTVRIREHDAQGRWMATRRDAMSEHRDVTMTEMLARVPLRDPRRRNFEENGMTCVQCHVRAFDDGRLDEVQVSDPRVHEPITPARPVERVRFQVLPLATVPRSPWLRQQEAFQVCDLGRKIHAQLNVDVSSALPCADQY